ncbi:MAG: T9SS type A sorting domain-containing protein [FCB group bacterium]|jgi:predicted esterase
MKNKIYIILFLFLLFASAKAQVRYKDKVFTEVNKDTSVYFGINPDYTGLPVSLFMDVYQPAGDTTSKRPLVIWVHGGGFVGGVRNDSLMLGFCTDFSQRGYITSSIDYRLGGDLTDFTQLQKEATEAILRSVQDAKAAVRFFRKNASEYKIDTSLIIIAGTSAGGFTAVHTAYWDENEIPSNIDTATIGNIEGSSGNPGYSSKVQGVVNCWGAILDTNWIKAGNQPIVSVHGTADDVVPYDYGLSEGILPSYGSAAITRRAEGLDIPCALRPFIGAGHTLAGGTNDEVALKLDTADLFIIDFLYRTFIEKITSVPDLVNNNEKPLKVFPNPASDYVQIEYNVPESSNISLILYDRLGRAILTLESTFKASGKYFLTQDINNIPSGIYFLREQCWGNVYIEKVVISN